tara:strand:+ start:1718 stop:2101 length:384 start_codon:yes stop_codon:yes gene_type:complete
VIDRLIEGWTPEQIAGRLGYDGQPVRVSHETIYAYVYSAEGQSEELARQPYHDPREHSHVAPSLPAVVEGLVRTIFVRRITPPQAVAIYKYNAAQHAAVIDARHTMALGEIGPTVPSDFRSASKDCS